MSLPLKKYSDIELLEELERRGHKVRIKINSAEVSVFIAGREFDVIAT